MLQDKKAFFQKLGCDAEIVKICVRDSEKPRDFKVESKTEVRYAKLRAIAGAQKVDHTLTGSSILALLLYDSQL